MRRGDCKKDIIDELCGKLYEGKNAELPIVSHALWFKSMLAMTLYLHPYLFKAQKAVQKNGEITKSILVPGAVRREPPPLQHMSQANKPHLVHHAGRSHLQSPYVAREQSPTKETIPQQQATH